MSERVKLVDPGTGLDYRAGGAQDASGNTQVANVPSGGASAAPSSAETATASGSLVVKASPGNLYGFEICTGAQAGYLMVFNSATVPADGTVTPKRVYAVAANASLARRLDVPIRCSAGIVLVFSSTGPFTKTASATAFLAGDYV